MGSDRLVERPENVRFTHESGLFAVQLGMSALGQKRTSGTLFDYIVDAAEE